MTVRLAEQLRADIGSRSVFRDEGDLMAGVSWSKALDEAIDGCDEWGWTSEIDPSFHESFE